jgi:hypothetical protein
MMRSWMWIALAAVVFGGAFVWLGGNPTVQRTGPAPGTSAPAAREEGKAKAASIGERKKVAPSALRRATPDAAHLRDLAARQQAMRDGKTDPAEPSGEAPTTGQQAPAARAPAKK